MALNGIPGLSLVVVQDGSVSYRGALGVRSVHSKEPMGVDTLVELASASKSLTALAVLRLARQGRLDLDTGVSTYLSRLGGVDWNDLTVRHLLRHTSGLRRTHDSLLLRQGGTAVGRLRSAAAIVATAVPESEPGLTFSYANANYVLLAALVERASGQPFASYMREHVFAPLGMQRTTLDSAAADRRGAADLHEQQWGRVRRSPSSFRGWPGSSLVKSSAVDMGAYLTALLAADGTTRGSAALDADWWEGFQPDYDFGWFVEPAADWLDGDFALVHTGEIWGANSAVALAPRRGHGVAVLLNLGTVRAGSMARAILASLDGTPLPPAKAVPLTEVADHWAIAFLATTVVLLAAMTVYGTVALRHLRDGRRAWRIEAPGIIRAAALMVLAVVLPAVAAWGPGPPFSAYPATVRLALPPLVGCVVALFLFAAALGLAPLTAGHRR